MAVRCKFVCNGKEPGESGNVSLAPVWASKEGVEGNAVTENHVFGKWTPTGNITMNIQNPDAFAQFELGAEYYVDFTPAPKPVAAE